MDARLLLFLVLCVGVNSEYVSRKFCKNVDQTKCSIHSVMVDPCPDGPGFCLLRRGKPYALTVDFRPHFSATKLKMSIHSEDLKSGAFDRVLMPTADACQHLSCPLEAEERRIFKTTFTYDFKAFGKFPVEFRLWNENDESEACCFTFTANVLKQVKKKY